jgi:hypothetical protein
MNALSINQLLALQSQQQHTKSARPCLFAPDACASALLRSDRLGEVPQECELRMLRRARLIG